MILRIALCIPTYNNPLTIEAVVLDCLAETTYPILVVDDGSSQPVRELFVSAPVVLALAEGRLQVLRLPQNEGKGAALQKAFIRALQMGWTHLVTLDGDGQHYAREAHKLIALARQYPWDLIIGQRQMEAANVPGVSKFGRKFSNFWVDYQTGHQVADSQSGYRLYPLFQVQNMRFWTKRYDFEIEVLIRLIWKGAHVREVESEVHYPKNEERVSHFDKFWDNLRISCLNTVFVVVSLLRTHRSPREAALALGSGVMIGCSPFFGLHMFLAAAVSFFFRLNGIFLLLGSQISIPPVAPFLIAGSLWIGTHLTAGTSVSVPHHFGEALTFAGAHFLQWFLGSLILGAGLGSIVGLLTYVIAFRLQRPANNWSGRTRGGRFGNGFLKVILKFVGLRAGYFCLRFIVPYFYLFAPTGRKALNEYWRMTNPKMGALRRQGEILRHFYRFGQVLMDRAAQSFTTKALFKTNKIGFENLLAPLREERAVIVLGAHVGGWDLSTALAGRDGLTQRLSVVQFQSQGHSFQDVKEDKGSSHLTTLLTNRGEQPIFDIHRLVSEKRPIGLMGDRPMGNRIELVSFFGKLAPFDVTAFRLAAATRTPLLSTYVFRTKSGEYDFYSFPSRMYEYDSSDRAEQCYAWVQAYVAQLEEMLRRYPEQWFNFYPFWSKVPTPLDRSSEVPQEKPAR